jgi:predicted acylesterase/phospholipase RssA
MFNIKKASALAVLIGSLFSSTQVEAKDVCRALALSGGGSKGAYEAGVVYGLVH